MTYSIREVKPQDVDAVVSLVRDVLGEFGIAFGEGSTTDAPLLDLPESYAHDGGRFWVAVDGASGEIVGTCGVAVMEPGVFELRKMYLRGSTRGHGLGRRLLEAAVAFVRAAGAKRIVLDTTEQMKAAIAFYEANGFVRDDRYIHGSRCTRGYVRELRD